MYPRQRFAVLVGLLVTLVACEADEEAFEQGATLEPPEAIEDAPLTDGVGSERLEGESREIVPVDTLQEVDIKVDTAS